MDDVDENCSTIDVGSEIVGIGVGFVTDSDIEVIGSSVEDEYVM